MPIIGEIAPDFVLNNQSGDPVRLSEIVTKQPVVLYFYPKDDTPGCILEACSFRDQYEGFIESGALVIGVSSDDEASHARFQARYQLPYPLLSDPKGKVAQSYGVNSWLLPGRETFVIDTEQIIRNRFSSQILIFQHVSEALKALNTLKKEDSLGLT